MALHGEDRLVFPRTSFYQGTQAFSDRRTVLFQRYRTGEAVRNWREKISEGSDATGAFTADYLSIESEAIGSASCFAQTAGSASQSHQFDGYYELPVTAFAVPTASATKAEAIALAKTYRKIEAELSAFNSPAALAEFTGVLRQFGRPYAAVTELMNRHLNRLYLESRRLRGSTSFRKLKWRDIVASTWLETTFGLLPLISDTRDIAEAVARWKVEETGDHQPRARITSQGSDLAAQVTHGTDLMTLASVTGMIAFKRNIRVTQERKVQYVCGLGATRTADYGSNDRLIELLGFDAKNWIPAIWEAIPWSWLADYFLNIQHILQAGVTSTASVKWVSKTTVVDDRREVSLPVDFERTRARLALFGYVKNVSISGATMGDHVVRRMSMSRQKNVSLGVPPLVLSYPQSWMKLANMSAALFGRRTQSSALWLT